MTDTETKKCRSCGKSVIWVETEKGRMMPVDETPTETGNIIIVIGPDMGKTTAHYESKEETKARLRSPEPAARTAFTSHFATCPQADKWRSKK